MNRWFCSAVFLSIIAPEAATFALFGLTLSATVVVLLWSLLEPAEARQAWPTQSLS